MNYLVVFDVLKKGGDSVGNALLTTNSKLVVVLGCATLVFDDEETARRSFSVDKLRLQPVWSDGPEFMRGVQDCYQDTCENCWPSTVYPESKGAALCAPKYVKDPEDFMRGYVAMSEFLVGDDWCDKARKIFDEMFAIAGGRV